MLVDAACRYDRPSFASLYVRSIERVELELLDESDAEREDAGNVLALRDALHALYPGARAFWRVRFELVDASPISARACSSSSASPR